VTETTDRLLWALDQMPIEKLRTGWNGLFEGVVDLRIVSHPTPKVTRVRLSFPTSSSDYDDYVWAEELSAGFTSKVRLVQAGGSPIAQRVVGLSRLGLRDEDTPDRYDIEFDLVDRTIWNTLSIEFLCEGEVWAIAHAEPLECG
jgi:hypothetical protein